MKCANKYYLCVLFSVFVLSELNSQFEFHFGLINNEIAYDGTNARSKLLPFSQIGFSYNLSENVKVFANFSHTIFREDLFIFEGNYYIHTTENQIEMGLSYNLIKSMKFRLEMLTTSSFSNQQIITHHQTYPFIYDDPVHSNENEYSLRESVRLYFNLFENLGIYFDTSIGYYHRCSGFFIGKPSCGFTKFSVLDNLGISISF